MYIGALAKLTGASHRAIRLYEELGLLTDVQRSGAYRIYSVHHAQQVGLIRQAQALGFKLSELNSAAFLKEGQLNWREIENELRKKSVAIQTEIRRLKMLDEQLTEVLQEIQECRFDPGQQNLDACTRSAPDSLH